MTFTERAAELDRDDELSVFREELVPTAEPLIYLDGNSLGRPLRASVAAVKRALERGWAERLVRGWGEGWLEAPRRIGDPLAKLIGAGEGEVLVTDSTSVNLYKLAHAALDAAAGRSCIVTDTRNFPSDVHVLAGVARMRGKELRVIDTGTGVEPDLDAIVGALDDRVAILSLSHVEYQSGFLHDLPALTRLAHDRGALVLFDLCHSVGVVPIDLEATGVDLAVGCTYKHLNGGPGAPAFLYVRRELQERLWSPIQGWLGSARPFDMGTAYEPAQGIDRFLAGTPPILSLLAVEPAIEQVARAGVERLRRKSMAMTSLLIELCDAHLAPLGFSLRTPRDPSRRGSHVALAHPHAWQIDQALIAEAHVIPDFRPPDVLRLGVSPLHGTFGELVVAVERIATIVRERRHEKYPETRASVT